MILCDPKTIVMILPIVNPPTNQPSVILETKQNVMVFIQAVTPVVTNAAKSNSHTGTTQSDEHFRF